jgi:hypothetical protein
VHRLGCNRYLYGETAGGVCFLAWMLLHRWQGDGGSAHHSNAHMLITAALRTSPNLLHRGL